MPIKLQEVLTGLITHKDHQWHIKDEQIYTDPKVSMKISGTYRKQKLPAVHGSILTLPKKEGNNNEQNISWSTVQQ